MARDAELRAKITAQDDASKVIEKAAKAADEFEKPREVKLDAEVAGALAALDQVAAEAKQTAEAAEALGRALGPELAAKADPGAIVSDLKQMGLSLDQIKGNADQLAGKMRELSDADVGGKLGSSLGTTRGKMDDLAKSADSSKSVLANMVGNTTQDLGALGGIAGSAGVAIGQMGEYMADAAGSGDKLGDILKNFGTVAVPLAAVGVVTKVITDEFERNAKAAAANEKSITDLVKAFAEGQTVLDVFVKTIKDTGKLEFDVGDIAGDLKAVNLSVSEFSKLAEGTPEQLATWTAAQRKLVTEGTPAYDSMRTVVFALVQANAQAAEATKRHENTVDILADTYVTEREAILAATIAQKARVKELDKADEAKRARENAMAYVEFSEGMHKLAVEQEKAAAVAKEFNDTIASADFGAAGLQGGLAGMSKFHEQFFGLKDIAAANEEAFDNLTKSFKDNGDTLDLNTEKGRANQKAVEDLASTIDLQLVAAFDDAHGSLGEFSTSAANVANTLRNRLINEMGLSATKADELIAQLGLLPEDIETRYKLSGDEEAKAKLALLQTSIDNLPKDVQAVVTQKIIMGDYVGALGTVQDYYNRHPVTVPVELRVSTANLTAAQMAAINAGRSVTPAPPPPVITPLGATTVAAPGATAQGVAPIVVPVAFQMPTSAEVARRIGPVRIPLFVQANLLADRRINGNL